MPGKGHARTLRPDHFEADHGHAGRAQLMPVDKPVGEGAGRIHAGKDALEGIKQPVSLHSQKGQVLSCKGLHAVLGYGR